MKDICIDYCEATICDNCKYINASEEEREDAYYEVVNDIAKGD